MNLISNDIRDMLVYFYLVNVIVFKLINNKVERLKVFIVEKLKRVEILFIDFNKLIILFREIEFLNFIMLALD